MVQPINKKLNILDNIDFTSTDLEKELAHYPLEIPKNNKVQNAVENTRFPAFAVAFYDLLIKKQHVPTQKELFDYYLSYNGDESVKIASQVLSIKDMSVEHTEALRTRIYKRAYPSLIRDVHCGLLVRENTLYSVFSSIEYDVGKGIDLVLDDKYAIHLWLVTGQSLYYRSRKKKYRHDYSSTGLINIELPLDPFHKLGEEFNGQKVGKYFLYSQNEVGQLVKKIEQKEAENNKLAN